MMTPQREHIHYLSSAGVLIESNGKKVLIDALNRDLSPYRSIPATTAQALFAGTPPYDNIDLMLITHEHSDHFDADAVAEFCRRHPDVRVLSNSCVIQALRNRLDNTANLTIVNPERFTGTSLTANSVFVDAVSLQHAGREYEGVRNLAFVLHLGRTFVHTGDAFGSLANLRALQEFVPNDSVFLAPFPYLTLKSSYAHLCQMMRPGLLYLLHLPDPERDRENWIQTAKQALSSAKRHGPRIVMAENEGHFVHTLR